MKIILYNVDSQNDFIRPDGKLPVSDSDSIIKKMEKLHFWARKRYIQTLYSADTHNDNCEEFSDKPNYVTTYPPHCLRNTNGSDIISELKPKKWGFVLDWDKNYSTDEINKNYATTDTIILKDRLDVFTGNQYFNDYIKAVSPDLIIICGVVSENSVSLAVDGFLSRGKRVILVMDAIKHMNYDTFILKLNEWSKSKDFELMTVDNVINTL